MSTVRLLLPILAALATLAGPAVAQQALLESRYVRFDRAACTVMESGRGQDYVLHRCRVPGAAPLWVLFQDSNRWSVGLGTTPNVAVLGLALDQTGQAIEIRGAVTNGRFAPRALIVRRRPFFAEDRASNAGELVVLRLDAAGSRACVVGEAPPGPGQNERARTLADRDGVACAAEPTIIPLRRPTR